MARKSFEVKNPEKRFSGWAFDVIEAHWDTLGVVNTWVIDADRTAKLRKTLAEAGVPKKEFMKRSIQRLAYVDRVARAAHFEGTISKTTGEPFAMPPQRGYNFAEGHFFQGKGGRGSIQILEVDDNLLDVCQRDSATDRFRQPYRLPADELAEWLRTGEPPESRKISPYEIRSETMRQMVRTDREALGIS